MKILKKLFARLLYSVALPTGIIVASLYIFHSLGNITYLIASVLAFAIGFFAIYLVFKYWIDTNIKHDTHEQQMMRFMIVFIIMISINTEVVYILTYVEVPLITAQTVAAVMVAYLSFYAYRSLVFKAASRRSVSELAAQGRAFED